VILRKVRNYKQEEEFLIIGRKNNVQFTYKCNSERAKQSVMWRELKFHIVSIG
jgi:hypothetical protein